MDDESINKMNHDDMLNLYERTVRMAVDRAKLHSISNYDNDILADFGAPVGLYVFMAEPTAENLAHLVGVVLQAAYNLGFESGRQAERDTFAATFSGKDTDD